eukprot:scaffold32929_cov55-Phaeocystis_antarctica.AAC.3
MADAQVVGATAGTRRLSLLLTPCPVSSVQDMPGNVADVGTSARRRSSCAAARAPRQHGLGPPPAPRAGTCRRRQPARAARGARPRPCQWPRRLDTASGCRRATHSHCRADHHSCPHRARVDRGAACRAAQRQRQAAALAQPRHAPLLRAGDGRRRVPELVPGANPNPSPNPNLTPTLTVEYPSWFQ